MVIPRLVRQPSGIISSRSLARHRFIWTQTTWRSRTTKLAITGFNIHHHNQIPGTHQHPSQVANILFHPIHHHNQIPGTHQYPSQVVCLLLVHGTLKQQISPVSCLLLIHGTLGQRISPALSILLLHINLAVSNHRIIPQSNILFHPTTIRSCFSNRVIIQLATTWQQ